MATEDRKPQAMRDKACGGLSAGFSDDLGGK